LLFFFFLTAKFFLKVVPLIGAVSLFAGSISQFEYAGQAKQYSVDGAICIFLVWSAIYLFHKNSTEEQKWVIALIGAISILSCFQAIPLSLFLLAVLW
jgi:chromate transport protein ChrA